jgi:hypothetical protein
MADVTLYFESCGYTSQELSDALDAPAIVTPLEHVRIAVVVEEGRAPDVEYLMNKRGYVYVSQESASQGQSYVVETYHQNGRLQTRDEYATDNGDGTYSGLRARESYTYQGSRVVSKTTEWYEADGVTVRRTHTTTYAANTAQRKQITKKQVT